MALELIQPLTEMSTRNIPSGKKRPARRADNFAATCEPNIWKCGSLNLSQPQVPAQPALPFTFLPNVDSVLHFSYSRQKISLLTE
jgi:hypothetical protein